MHYLHNVLHVFFGTARRAGWTLGIFAVVYFSFRPSDLMVIVRSVLHNIIVPVLQETVTALANAVGPIMGPILTILLVIFGFKLILKGVRRK